MGENGRSDDIDMEPEDVDNAGEEEHVTEKDEVYLPGDPIENDEELTYDKSAYLMYHAAQTGSPCLSFDVVPDKLGVNRADFPMTCYLVSGSQAEAVSANQILVMKMSNLTKMDSDGESDSSYVDDQEEGPVLQTYSIKHVGGVNRIRCCLCRDTCIVASWADTGKVHIWDVSSPLYGLDAPGAQDHQTASSVKPLFTFGGHQAEGFAMDWSNTVPGKLATGSCNKNIHIWQMKDSSTWNVDQRPLNAHTDSVEDIQWSPNEANVLASCSVDQTIRIWDTRAVGAKACMISCKAHDTDVNVISWSRADPFIISGGDDGIVKVWDLRMIQDARSVAVFKHHTGPITSVEWHPTDNTVFAASGADNQITFWDLAVEKDDSDEIAVEGKHLQLPPQLLFIHMGQEDIKELHWHRQIPGVLISTAASGFNIFKTISV